MQDDRYPAPFIASSIPIKEKEENFLEMIMQNNCKIVVCLKVLVNISTLDFCVFAMFFVEENLLLTCFCRKQIHFYLI